MTKRRQAELIYKGKEHLFKIGLFRIIAIGQNTHGPYKKEQKSKAQKDIRELSRI